MNNTAQKSEPILDILDVPDLDELGLPETLRNAPQQIVSQEPSRFSSAFDKGLDKAKNLTRRENLLTQKNAVRATIVGICATIGMMTYSARAEQQERDDKEKIQELLKDEELKEKIIDATVELGIRWNGIDVPCAGFIVDDQTVLASGNCSKISYLKLRGGLGNGLINPTYKMTPMKNGLVVKITFGLPYFRHRTTLPVAKKRPEPGEAHAFVHTNSSDWNVDGMAYGNANVSMSAEQGTMTWWKPERSLWADTFRSYDKPSAWEALSGPAVNKSGEIVGMIISGNAHHTHRRTIPITEEDVHTEAPDIK